MRGRRRSLELTIPIDVRGIPSRWWGPTRALESWQAWTGGEPQQSSRRAARLGRRALPPADRPAHRLPRGGAGAAAHRRSRIPRTASWCRRRSRSSGSRSSRRSREEARGLSHGAAGAFNKAEREVENTLRPSGVEARARRARPRHRSGLRVRRSSAHLLRRGDATLPAARTDRGRLRGASASAPAGSRARATRCVRSRWPSTCCACNRRGASYMLPLGVDACGRQAVLAGAVCRLEPRTLRRGRDQTEDRRSGRQHVGGILSKVEGGSEKVAGRAGSWTAVAAIAGCCSCLARAPFSRALARRPEPLWETGTFSILGFDPATGEVGGAVQSRVFSVGNGVLWADANAGIAATQAIVDVGYGAEGARAAAHGAGARRDRQADLGRGSRSAARRRGPSRDGSSR